MLQPACHSRRDDSPDQRQCLSSPGDLVNPHDAGVPLEEQRREDGRRSIALDGIVQAEDRSQQPFAGCSDQEVVSQVGASRKRFLGTILGLDDPIERDRATSILSALLFERGAGIVRVHEVAGTREALALVRTIVSA